MIASRVFFAVFLLSQAVPGVAREAPKKPKNYKSLPKANQVFFCAITGDLIELKRLLEDGIPVSGARNSPGSLLTSAVHYDQTAVADFLLRRGADPHVTNLSNFTPLMLAVENNNRYLARKLIGLGADINAETPYPGGSVLNYCLTYPDCGCAELALDLGADPNLKRSDGYPTPPSGFDLAQKKEEFRELYAKMLDYPVRSDQHDRYNFRKEADNINAEIAALCGRKPPLPPDFSERAWLAKHYFSGKDYAKALVEYRYLADAMPAAPALQYNTAMLEAWARRHRVGAGRLRCYLKLKPDAPDKESVEERARQWADDSWSEPDPQRVLDQK